MVEAYLRCALVLSLLFAQSETLATIRTSSANSVEYYLDQEHGVLRGIRSAVVHDRVAEIPAGICDMDPAGNTR